MGKKFPEQRKTYAPAIQIPGRLSVMEPEKISLSNDDKTQLLQIGKDRLVLNWRHSLKDEKVDYPKYVKIKSEFIDCWKIFLDYIKKYKSRTIKIIGFELYYSNLLYVGQDCFLKEGDSIKKAIDLPLFGLKYQNQSSLPIYLGFNMNGGNDFTFQLEKVKIKAKDIPDKEAFLQVFFIRNNGLFEDIDKKWYDKAHDTLNEIFEDIITEEAKLYYKGD